jgi:hypothetical protein
MIGRLMLMMAFVMMPATHLAAKDTKFSTLLNCNVAGAETAAACLKICVNLSGDQTDCPDHLRRIEKMPTKCPTASGEMIECELTRLGPTPVICLSKSAEKIDCPMPRERDLVPYSRWMAVSLGDMTPSDFMAWIGSLVAGKSKFAQIWISSLFDAHVTMGDIIIYLVLAVMSTPIIFAIASDVSTGINDNPIIGKLLARNRKAIFWSKEHPYIIVGAIVALFLLYILGSWTGTLT